MLLRIAAVATLLLTHDVSATSSSRSLRASTPKSTTDDIEPTRELMENMDTFTPLPCNANLTVQNCDGTTLLSSLIAAQLS